MKIFSLLLLPFSLLITFSAAADVVFKDSRIVDPRMAKVLSAHEYFCSGTAAMEKENWKKAVKEFNAITKFHPNSDYLPNAYYFAGISLYHLKEYELANNALDNYMNAKSDLNYFEETIKHKFSIAEFFRKGSKRRPFGTSEFFKFLPGHQISLKIYDEVIAAVPNHDLAAQSLFCKACLLWKLKEFKESTESFQILTRRFPKHELAPQAYLNIAKVYVDQSRSEFQNPDLISLAEVNVKKFRTEFPRDDRIVDAENEIIKLKEVYARGLYDTARFYQRVYKNKSSIIYYENAIRQYPDTEIAALCKERLKQFAPKILERLEKTLAEERMVGEVGQFKLTDFENLNDLDFEEFALPTGQIDFL